MLSLVYRAEAINTNDGTWKYTALLICSVVENGVAIMVSCAPGCAKFSRVYVSEWKVIKSLRSTLGGSNNSKSGEKSKPSWDQPSDPNRERTGRRFGRQVHHEFDELSDTLILQTASSVGTAARDETTSTVTESQAPKSSGIARTIDITQESHHAGLTAPLTAHGTQLFQTQQAQIQQNPVGVAGHGSGADPAPTYPTWLRLASTSDQHPHGAYYVPYYGSEVITPADSYTHTAQDSTGGFAPQKN